LIDVQPLTRVGAFSRALDLYGELFAAVQERARDEGERATLRERYERGRTILETHRDSAADVPLSAPAAELVEAYLAGPDPEDHEAHREWLTVLPEVFVGVRRAEELEDAAQHQTLDALLRDTTRVGEAYSATLLAAMRAIALPSITVTESAWRTVQAVTEINESVARSLNFALDFLADASASAALTAGMSARLIAQPFAPYSAIAPREAGDDASTREAVGFETVDQYAKAA
jgi:hypothetical protein